MHTKEEAPLSQGHWLEDKRRKEPLFPEGETIVEVFLRTCARMGNSPAVADEMLGVYNYPKLKLAAIVLAEEIRKLPGERIGVLLPASTAAYLLILAIQMADKTPVMLNWTLGPKYLDYMIDTASVKTVISSWKFLERLSYVEFGELSSKLLLLENIEEENRNFLKTARAFSLLSTGLFSLTPLCPLRWRSEGGCGPLYERNRIAPQRSAPYPSQYPQQSTCDSAVYPCE